MGTIIFILCLIILWAVISYNKMNRLRLNIEKSKSGIDVYCQQRFDLIPNLVEVVKEYTHYEKNVLETITSLRMQYAQTKDLQLAQEVNEHLNTLLVQAERYPSLKANEQFMQLQKSLLKMESQLQAARRIYNDDVTSYNIVIQSFPVNLLAPILGFRTAALFELENKAASDPVKIDFSQP